jgi:RNA-directed DNA polymerase
VHGRRDDVEAVREDLADVLGPLGLRLSPAKTRVVHMNEGFDFLGFRIQRRRKRGTNQWYVYTFIADRPLKAVKAKIRGLTHKVSQADPRTILTRINQILRGWVNYFRHAVCKHTLNHLRHFVNWRIMRWLMKLHRWRWGELRRQFTTPSGRWLMKLHRWRWGELRRQFTTPSGRWLPLAVDGIELFNPASVPVTRYRYRGTIPTPWARPNHA